MSNIFNIEEKYLHIMTQLEEGDGEITEELAEQLAINEEDRDQKMSAYAYVIQEKKANSAVISDEIQRLRTLSKSNDNIATRLKKALMNAMEVFDLRNKNGNLAHRLQYHNMFTRNTKAVILNEVILSSDGEEQYANLLTFNITSKLTKSQLDRVIATLAEEDESYLDVEYTANVDKAVFKELWEDVNNMQDTIILDNAEVENPMKVEAKVELTYIGEVVTNTSLTIK